jgi:hypothetical protein
MLERRIKISSNLTLNFYPLDGIFPINSLFEVPGLAERWSGTEEIGSITIYL